MTDNCPANCNCICCIYRSDKSCHCFTYPCSCGLGPAEHVVKLTRAELEMQIMDRLGPDGFFELQKRLYFEIGKEEKLRRPPNA